MCKTIILVMKQFCLNDCSFGARHIILFHPIQRSTNDDLKSRDVGDAFSSNFFWDRHSTALSLSYAVMICAVAGISTNDPISPL